MNTKIKIEQMLKAANAYACKAGLELSLEGENVLITKYTVRNGVRVTVVEFQDSFKFISTSAYELKDALKGWSGDLCTPAGVAEELAGKGIDPEDAPFGKVAEVMESQREVLDVVMDYIRYLEAWLEVTYDLEYNMNDEVEGYVVEVTETLTRSYFVGNVEDSTQARKLISGLYDREEIVLTSEDLKSVDIECKTPLGNWYNPGLPEINATDAVNAVKRPA